MAKKKNRSINITRKRTKRKQMQKQRRKMIAMEKNRTKAFTRFNEKILGEKIIKSSILAEEPEFSNLRFDHEKSLIYSRDLLEKYNAKYQDEDDEMDMEMFYDEYRTEVIQKLLTEEFIHSFVKSLKSCATRLRRIGNYEAEELANITLTIMELADEFPLSLHPLIITIYEKTMKEAVINRITKTSSGEDVQELLERLRKLREESDVDNGKLVIKEIKEIFEKALEKNQSPDLEDAQESVAQAIPERELPAKTLYKTLNFEEVRSILSTQNCFQNISNNGNELNFIKSDSNDNSRGNEEVWLITLKPERLLVECKCSDHLKTAMEGIEKLCGEHLMYLAKSVSE
ncbi:MAG: hypothetical protein ACE5PV_16970 [Candidatus Poribacteria bacterium]